MSSPEGWTGSPWSCPERVDTAGDQHDEMKGNVLQRSRTSTRHTNTRARACAFSLSLSILTGVERLVGRGGAVLFLSESGWRDEDGASHSPSARPETLLRCCHGNSSSHHRQHGPIMRRPGGVTHTHTHNGSTTPHRQKTTHRRQI